MSAHLRLAALAAAVTLALAGCTSSSSGGPTSSPPQPPSSTVDWNAVEQALGVPLQTEDQVHHADMPRDDLHVTVGNVALAPGMEIASEVNFLPTTADNALLIGEMTVLDSEQPKVIDALQRGGIEVTAIHKHLPAQSPDIWWIHFAGYERAVAEASALHTALAATATPLPPASKNDEPLPDLDTGALDGVLGTKGQIEDGVYQSHLPVTQNITDTRAQVKLPAEMEASSLVLFQPLPNGQAATNGDLAFTADKLNPVIATLRHNNIDVVTVHNHMLYEQPRLFYLHFWATGDAVTLARALRAAADKTH